ncbi:MAG: 16S rRNA (guanine(527)-N(7))-methyltransferase RsmG [Oscillospiraceae bacterium]|nr:16S rRNA (guanine(527)-N(7))-methyltransferase RsmG [Oscillospiraceae bacterium]
MSEYGISISDEEYDRFEKYTDMLIEKNKVMNLTRIVTPEDITVKHILDSLLVFRYADLPESGRVVDVGTGAGLPGVVMKIHRPQLEMTLMDSLLKRINFLKEVSDNVIPMECVHSRAEDAGRGKYREVYDAAVARAVAAFPVLCEYCIPLVKVGGVFVAMKGLNEEIDGAKAAQLGGEIVRDERYELPGGDGRRIITVRKIRPTDKKYPSRKIKS